MPTDRKEYMKEYNKKRYEANKDKIKEYNKEWKEKNKDKIKEWREENKEKKKEWNEANKDKIKEYNKEWREKNKEYDKEYKQTEKGKKSNRISTWKHNSIKSDNYDKLYEYFINVKNCEECEVELVEGNKSNNSRCLDHNHKTGLFRNVLCNSCNVKRK
jgi:hypothetical protein